MSKIQVSVFSSTVRKNKACHKYQRRITISLFAKLPTAVFNIRDVPELQSHPDIKCPRPFSNINKDTAKLPAKLLHDKIGNTKCAKNVPWIHNMAKVNIASRLEANKALKSVSSIQAF